MNRCLIFALIVLAAGTPAQAQEEWRQSRRREIALITFGRSAQGFLDAYQDDACKALFALSKDWQRWLVRFHESRELSMTAKPRDLLLTIGLGDDGTAAFIANHAVLLRDIDACNAYLAAPSKYVHGTWSLQYGAACARANRMQAQPDRAEFPELPDLRPLAGIAGFMLLVALFVWWKKRRSVSAVA
jgi:hypothetical protein